tara:strand:- start:151 stop:462 length:312 start_codon:yes stop_codon:yes gene_type:complete
MVGNKHNGNHFTMMTCAMPRRFAMKLADTWTKESLNNFVVGHAYDGVIKLGDAIQGVIIDGYQGYFIEMIRVGRSKYYPEIRNMNDVIEGEQIVYDPDSRVIY